MTPDDGPTADDAGQPAGAGTRDGGDAPGAETDGPPAADADTDGDLVATYTERDGERRLTFERCGASGDAAPEHATARRTVVAQPLAGYGMLTVRDGDGRELERYYGFDMALDHAAERLGVRPAALPVPEAASDMGM